MALLKNVNNIEFEKGIKEFLQSAPDIYLPGVSVDTVIFSFHNDKLKALLLRLGETPYFSLPGGFIKKEENLDDAALRILQERTGLENIYLEQFYTSGNNVRYKKNVLLDNLKAVTNLPPDNWLEQRFISICFYALVDETKVNPKPERFGGGFQWTDIKHIPELLYDHNLIIEKALSRLQADLDKNVVGFNLMNESFTMAELQKLYEAIYQKKFLRTNFQRKILSSNMLERLEKKYNGKAHKAPYLYRFIENK